MFKTDFLNKKPDFFELTCAPCIEVPLSYINISTYQLYCPPLEPIRAVECDCMINTV